MQLSGAIRICRRLAPDARALARKALLCQLIELLELLEVFIRRTDEDFGAQPLELLAVLIMYSKSRRGQS